MKRFLTLFLTLALVAGIFGGCGPQEAPNTDSSQSDTTQNTTVPPTTEPSTTAPTTQPDSTEPLTAGDIRINEVMPDNKHLLLGGENDWVELYNAGDTVLSLDGYSLTDDETKEKYPLDGLSIPAGGYLVLELDDAAPFRLSADGETVSLLFGGNVISRLTFGLEEEGRSLDANGPCVYATPGFANNQEGWLAYLDSRDLPELIISEAMTSNSKLYPVGGECYDMLEVYNASGSPISLKDYTLSDKRSEPARYSFPDVTLQPGECYVVYCSGEAKLGKNHASFKLSADGETVYLSKNGSFVDVLQIPALDKHQTYGRVGKIPMYLAEPTLGQPNGTGSLETLAVPAASLPSGVYAEAISLTLTGEGDIYYTLDGTEPTENSLKYTEPILIDGVKTLRTCCISNGRRASAAYTYVVGQSHDLPILVVEIPQENLTGEAGVLVNVEETYEYPAMMTLIENGVEAFSVPFGFRLHGNDSRKCPKQNFQVRFRSEYGCGRLNYALFEDREYTEFNSLLLKGGSEDWYGTNLRDELATSLVAGTNLYTQATKPVVLYLAGEYWGVYYIRERVSDDYVASNLNVSADSVDLLEYSSARVQDGDNQDYLALREYCKANDMSTDANYAWLCSQIDAGSLMDWYICRSFLADVDLDNIRRFRSSEGDNVWQWVFFDLDWSMYNMDTGLFSYLVNNPNGDRTLIQALLANAQGRDAFLRRYGELLNTVFTQERIDAALEELLVQISSEMPRDRERWGKTMAGWEEKVEKLRYFYQNDRRHALIKADLQAYFSLTDQQMQEYFG